MKKRRIAQVGLAVATTALCLLTIDRLVWHTFPLGTTVYRLEPDQLYEYIPGASKFFIHDSVSGGSWVRVRINRDGYRGPELASREAGHRVVVYGDSFVAAEFTPHDETYVAVLAAELSQATDRPVEAVNAGLVGAGPDQVARRMSRELTALRPSAIVLAITAANDFGDLIRNKLYTFDRDGALVERTPAVGPALRRGLEPSPLAQSGWGLLLRAARRGAPLRWRQLGIAGQGETTPPTLHELLAWRSREFENAVVRGDAVARNLFDDTYDADVSLLPRSRAARFKRRLMDGVLGELARIAREAAVPMLVMAIPSPIDVAEDHRGLAVEREKFPDYRRDALTDAVVEAADAHSLPSLDLFGPMRRADDPDDLFFAGGNDHWNILGQRLAAKLTAERISELSWLD